MQNEPMIQDSEASSNASLKPEKVAHVGMMIPEYIKKAQLFAVVTRADGRVEDLGLIASSDPDDEINHNRVYT